MFFTFNTNHSAQDAQVAKSKKPKADKSAEDGAPKKGGIKAMLGGIITPIVLGGAAFAAVYLLPSPGGTDNAASADEAAHEDTPGTDAYNKPAVETDIVPLKEITLSLSNSQSLLRISIALESPKKLASDIDPADLRLRDAFMGYLRSLSVEQLEDAGFLPQLREQLLRRSQLVLGPDHVTSILVTDFLIR